MRRLNCFSRKKSLVEVDLPVPSRPVIAKPHRSRALYSKSQVQSKPLRTNQPPQRPARQRAPREPAQNAMNNAVRRRAGRERAPPRSYIEISDDEDSEDDILALPPGRREPSSPRDVASPPPPAPNVNGAPQPRSPLDPLRQGNIAAQADADMRAFVGDDLDVNDPILAQYMMEGFIREHDKQVARAAQPVNNSPLDEQNEQPSPINEDRIDCIDQVLAVFSGICRDYVTELHATVAQSSETLVAHILEKLDKGTHYPKAKDTQRILKRKRDFDEDEEAARKYGSADRVIAEGIDGYRPYIRHMLSKDFPETPMIFIDSALQQSGYRLFSTYRVLEEAHRTFDPRRPSYNKIKHQRKIEDKYKEANLEATIQSMVQNSYLEGEVEILRELQASRRIRKKAEAKYEAEVKAEIEEQKNLLKAQSEGTMSECGCCYDEYPLNRMIHCDSEAVMHWFCRGCAKQSADTEIGNSKYELRCMSMDGCSAGFSHEQRSHFLDQTTAIALERNEQEANLRMAGIENLASCPFCPYAAEYPPIEIDREFRCQAPDCEKTSCRLCKLESHIPKSCEEHAKDQGLSVRRQIEEAMSAALIRKCNKCGTPFVKEEGCNKMTCTRNGCYNVQCYVCSKSCSYDHFDDTRRGGKEGNCPLFESVEERHDNEVKKAEKEALDKVRAEHPEYTEEDLKIKVSEDVEKDDERRKKADPRRRVAAFGGIPGRRYGFGPPPFQLIDPAPLPVYPQMPPEIRRAVPVAQHAQDRVADINLVARFIREDIFAQFWGEVAQVYANPPPPPPERPELFQLPLRAPQAGADIPVRQPAPVQYVYEVPAGPVAPWNILHPAIPGLRGGTEAAPDPAGRRPPDNAAPAEQAAALENQPAVEHVNPLQQLRDRANVRHRIVYRRRPGVPDNVAPDVVFEELPAVEDVNPFQQLRERANERRRFLYRQAQAQANPDNAALADQAAALENQPAAVNHVNPLQQLRDRANERHRILHGRLRANPDNNATPVGQVAAFENQPAVEDMNAFPYVREIANPRRRYGPQRVHMVIPRQAQQLNAQNQQFNVALPIRQDAAAAAMQAVRNGGRGAAGAPNPPNNGQARGMGVRGPLEGFFDGGFDGDFDNDFDEFE